MLDGSVESIITQRNRHLSILTIGNSRFGSRLATILAARNTTLSEPISANLLWVSELGNHQTLYKYELVLLYIHLGPIPTNNLRPKQFAKQVYRLPRSVCSV